MRTPVYKGQKKHTMQHCPSDIIENTGPPSTDYLKERVVCKD